MNSFQAPKLKHVTFSRSEGSFNLLKPSEREAQYFFHFPHLSNEQYKELGLTSSFFVDLERDYDFSPSDYTPLECLKEILDIYNGYWIHTGKQDVQKVIDYLESIEEDQERLRNEYAVEYAEAQVKHWNQKLSQAKEVTTTWQ